MNTYRDFPDWPEEGYGFIYFLRSPSGRGYVGQTRMPINKRVMCHVSKGGCRYLHAAILKHGIQNFFVGIVGQYPLRELDAAEIRFIQELETRVPLGYNILSGGQGGHCHDKDTRQRISDASKRHSPISEETRKRLVAACKRRAPVSEATRQKMSDAAKNRSDGGLQVVWETNRGRRATAETRQKMSDAHKNVSVETRQKISAAGKRRRLSDEHRRRIGESHKGICPSVETRHKMSGAAKRRPPIGDETRRKLSEATKARHAAERAARLGVILDNSRGTSPPVTQTAQG